MICSTVKLTKTKRLLLGAALLFFFVSASVVSAQFNQEINYQGKLTASDSVAVPDGSYSMTFRLYTVASGGTHIWTETQSVTVASGLFSVMLGSSTALTGVDFNQTLYLGVNVDGDGEMSPRKVLGAVPAAFEAKNASTVGGVASTSFLRSDEADTLAASTAGTLLTVTQSGVGDILNLFDGATEVFSVLDGGNVGIGTTTPFTKLSVAGNGFFGGNLTATGTLTVSGTTTLATTTIASSTITRINIAGDSITDFSGTGLSVSGGALTLNATGDWTGTFDGQEGSYYLNAANLTGTLASGRLSGSYTGITGVGTVTAGTWQGTAIASAYLDSTVILSSEIDTSSELAGVLGDETGGSGVAVFNAGPTLTGTTTVAGLVTTGYVGVNDPTPVSLLDVGGIDGTMTNVSTHFAVRNATNIGTTAGTYQYPFELMTNAGNRTRLQTTQYRRQDGSAWQGTAFRLQYAVDASFTAGEKAYIEMGGSDPSSSGGGFISFGTAGLDRLSINNSGYVGIGTTTPGAQLTVVSADDASRTGLLVYGDGEAGDVPFAVRVGATPGNLSAADTKLIVDYVGNVGIGTTTPFTKLSVAGNGFFGGNLTATGTLDVLGNITVGGTVDGKDIATYAAMLNEAETITADWVNTANPWADNEVADALTIAGGTINSTTIGATTPSTAVFTSATTTSATTTNLAISSFISGRVPYATTGGALTASSSFTYDGTTLTMTSYTNFGTMLHMAPNLTTNPLFTLIAPLTTDLGTGKAFQVAANGESFGRSIFYTDGSFGIGPGYATRDVLLSRSATSTFTISSDRSAGSANLIVTGNIGIGTTTPSHKLTVAGGGVSANRPSELSLVGSYDTSGNAYAVKVSDRYAYVADNASGLHIIDVSTPASPVLESTFNTSGTAYDVALAGRYAYVADSSAGLQVIDISNPASTTLTGTYDGLGNAYRVVLSGRYAYVTTLTNGIEIIDISNPASPTLAGSYDTSGSAYDVAVSGRYAYVADGTAGLRVIDITNPASTTLLGTYDTTGTVYDVAVSGRYAYVADDTAGLYIVDISNPVSPTLASVASTTGTTFEVALAGRYAYVAGSSGIHVVDVASSTNPLLIESYDPGGGGFGITIAGRYAYVADSTAGLAIVDINGSDFSSLFAGSLGTSQLSIETDFMAGNNGSVRGGFSVGHDAAIGGSLTITGNASSSVYTGDTHTALSVLSGRVGIGTSSPAARLHIYDTGGTTADGIRIGNGFDHVSLYFDGSADNSNFAINYNGSGGDDIIIDYLGNVTVGEAGDVYLSPSNNVGIGTTTAAAQLVVDGNSRFVGDVIIYEEDYSDAAVSIYNTSSLATGPDILLGTSGMIAVEDNFYFHIDSNYNNSNAAFVIAADGDNTGSSTELFRINETGSMGIGDASPSEAQLVVGNAGAGDIYLSLATAGTTNNAVCWDNAGATLLYDCDSPPADYAESYPTAAGIEHGHIVMLTDEQVLQTDGASVPRVTKADGSAVVLGVTSDNYHDFTSTGQDLLTPADRPMPVALVGRVPVKVTLEGGGIRQGDRIALSSVAGVGKKAEVSGEATIGIALADYVTATASGTVLVFVGNETHMTIEDQLRARLFSADLAASANMAAVVAYADTVDDTIWHRLARLAAGFVDGVLQLTGIQAEVVETEELCLGDTCVTEAELKILLEEAAVTPSTPAAVPTAVLGEPVSGSGSPSMVDMPVNTPALEVDAEQPNAGAPEDDAEPPVMEELPGSPVAPEAEG